MTEVSDEASVVLIGFDTENTSEKIRNTCIMLGRDVAYLATNPDLVCPVAWFHPGLRFHEHHAENATGNGTLFHREAPAYYGGLRIKTDRTVPGKKRSS